MITRDNWSLTTQEILQSRYEIKQDVTGMDFGNLTMAL